MSNRKLTLIFEANTAKAIADVRTLTSAINILNTSLGQNQGFDKGLTSAIKNSQQFVQSIDKIHQKLNTLGAESKLQTHINSWSKSSQLLNKNLDDVGKKLQNISNLSGKSFSDLSKLGKGFDVVLNVKKPREDLLSQNKQQIKETLTKKQEATSEKIKKEFAQKRIVERQKSSDIKASRFSKAEGIIADLAAKDKPNAIFKSFGSSLSRPISGRQFLNQKQIDEQKKIAEYKERNNQGLEKGFRKVTLQKQKIGIPQDNQNELRNLFSERAKLLTQERKEKEAQIKAEKEAERDRLRQELKNKQEQLSNSRKAGLKYIRNDNRGLGFGGSRLGKTQRESLPSFFGEAKTFGGELFQQNAPQSLQNIVQGASKMGAALQQNLGMGQMAALGLGAAISTGIVGGMALANFAVGEFTRQLENATKDQLALLGISSEVQRMYGVNQKTADAFYENLQYKTEIAGKDTSVSAQDITELNQMGITAFLNAYKDSDRSLDDLSKQAVEMNTRFAIMAQSTPGVTNFQVKNAYTSAITGNLNNALQRQEFFRNSGFGDVVRETAGEQGIDLTKATQIDQIDILQKALEKRIPTSLVERAQNDSIDAQMSSFWDTLFSQRVGVFGIQRDLDLDVEGNQSLFTEISRSVKLIFGKDGMFAQLGKILTYSGLNFDLMKMLRDGLRNLNNFLELINKLFQGINATIEFIRGIKIPFTNGTNVGNVIDTARQISPTNLISKGYQGISDWVYGLFGIGGNSFTGNIPDTKPKKQLSLIDSIASEMHHKPVGSNLLIANDSEYIFPSHKALQDYAYENIIPDLKQNFHNYTSQTSKQLSISPGAIVINGIGQNAQQIAQDVLNAINLEFSYEMSKYT